PALPVHFEEHRVVATPMRSGYRLGSTMEFAGYDATLNRRRLALLREGASHYLVEPCGEVVGEEWFGWRPMTPDSLAVIGPGPLGNVLIAAGHNMLGLSMAPATGKLVAELLGGGHRTSTRGRTRCGGSEPLRHLVLIPPSFPDYHPAHLTVSLKPPAP